MRSIAEIFSSHEVVIDGRHVNGTDKNGPNHRYGNTYQRILDYYDMTRKDVALMMEVGVADGSSLLAWSEIFPNARCVGLDIHHSDKAHGERIEFHLGDQRSLEDCQRAAAGRKFAFICEDATHQLDATLLTLLYLWHGKPAWSTTSDSRDFRSSISCMRACHSLSGISSSAGNGCAASSYAYSRVPRGDKSNPRPFPDKKRVSLEVSSLIKISSGYISEEKAITHPHVF